MADSKDRVDDRAAGTVRNDNRARAERASLPLFAAVVLALLGLATGAGLVVFFLSRVWLPLGIAGAGVAVGVPGALVWRRLDRVARRVVRRRAWAGMRAGLVATVAYDLTRLAVVELLGLRVRPFEAVPLFGQLLLNTSSATAATTVVGVVYHLTNGVGFGFAYALVAGHRGVLAGIVWGIALEAVMLSFYPGWLDIRSFREFFGVSMSGHLAYGATLGWTAQRLLTAPRPVVGGASGAR